MAAHFSVLAWKIPQTEEPGGYSPRGRSQSHYMQLAEWGMHLDGSVIFNDANEN